MRSNEKCSAALTACQTVRRCEECVWQGARECEGPMHSDEEGIGRLLASQSWAGLARRAGSLGEHTTGEYKDLPQVLG